MAFRIKKITDADKPRAYVTVEETDARGDCIPGREWTEKFSTVDKDWAELKKRLTARVKADDDEATKVTTLIAEANSAALTDITR